MAKRAVPASVVRVQGLRMSAAASPQGGGRVRSAERRSAIQASREWR